MFWISFEIVALILVVLGLVVMARADRRNARLRDAEEAAERRAGSGKGEGQASGSNDPGDGD